jgi:hypothetical protein
MRAGFMNPQLFRQASNPIRLVRLALSATSARLRALFPAMFELLATDPSSIARRGRLTTPVFGSMVQKG